MRDHHNSLVSRNFLKSVWGYDYEAFKDSKDETELEERLKRWAARADLKETSAEAALIEELFHQTWGYAQSGQQSVGKTWNSYPQYPVKGAGQKGASGSADLAMGYFIGKGENQVAQVLCEFKDIKSGLDVPQSGRKDGFSPVRQCLNYLSKARQDIAPNEPITPQWGIVTDMDEFRLYWHDRGKSQYLKFQVRKHDLFSSDGMVNIDNTLPSDDDARFERFLFWKVFHRETLTSNTGKPKFVQLIERQWVKQRELEDEFYKEYRALREHLYLMLLEFNPSFTGTKGRLVRLAQKILDRLIFIFFCEDMGAALKFPSQLLRDLLINRSRDPIYDPDRTNIWEDMLVLFKAMNEGNNFSGEKINQFNGGLFASDPELESLKVPNKVFCIAGQGANEASLYVNKLTVLYLSASYNYAGGWAEGLSKPLVGDEVKDKANAVKANPDKSLGLYTLGRIFEQSITELEFLEAEADGKTSLNELSKRKRDGVYYTPEWVVERIVFETITPILDRLKSEAKWIKSKNPSQRQIEAYLDSLSKVKVVDPACGSGAFLITTLRFLLEEYKIAQELRRSITATGRVKDKEEGELVRDILRSNIYGVDINAASVEIARLALWLHTARGDKPLSSLEGTIKEGNSLINDDFYKGQIDLNFYNDEERERINTFNWEQEFPEVFDQGGFDAVVGNPPYVKLQNFKKVHSDMAEFIRNGRDGVNVSGYASAKTGNFDLYVPFIEKGLELLNKNGHLGYIAPSVWVMNKYGEALRELVIRGKNLTRWLDFKSHQIFQEATVYTALQFFTKQANKQVQIAYAPDGVVPDEPWADEQCKLPTNKLTFDDRWLLVTGYERTLIDKLNKHCNRLDDGKFTTHIFQGLITSADDIYHLQRIGTDKYLRTPKGNNAPPPYEVNLEDEIMHPLVSGGEAKRYQEPDTDTYIVFPYQRNGNTVSLIPVDDMIKKYPLAWNYLLGFEDRLRKREASLTDQGEFVLDKQGMPTKAPHNDLSWYRFGRHQGLSNQETKKLIVAQTVPAMRVCADYAATQYLNNVRVNGILSTNDNLSYLLGILNSPTVNWVFKRIAKPKDGGWFEANKQFIAPLPIPIVTPQERDDVAERAEKLQEAHTSLRDKIQALTKRTSDMPSKNHPVTFLFPDIVQAKERLDDLPSSIEKRERRKQAKADYDQEIEDRYSVINSRLNSDALLEARLEDGELIFLVDGVPTIQRVFVSDEDGALILAQWKALASTFSISGKSPAKKLCNGLRKLVVTNNQAQIDQIIKLQKEISALEASIKLQEQEMNELTYKLYKLTDEEIKMVEQG